MKTKLTLKAAILSITFAAITPLTLSANEVKLDSDKDYIVTVTRPGNLILADAEEMKVINNCKITEKFSPGGVVLAPNNKYAFVLGGYGEEIGGYNIRTCERIFHASITKDDIQGKSLAGIAVSEDSKKIYTIYNRTKIGMDRYTVLPSMFSAFNVSDGLDAQAIQSFEIPRQMTLISVANDGTIYGIGSALYEIDTKAEKAIPIKKILGKNKPNYSDPDSAGNYIIGQHQGDFSTLYYTEEFNSKGEDIGWYWGITSVDLKTNKVEQFEFTDYETLMFTIMRSPVDRNIAYGVLNDLTKFDLKNKEVLKRVVLDHTYYSQTVSNDGEKLYLGSTLNDIAIYSSDKLEKLGNIYLPGDMGSAALQVFHTD